MARIDDASRAELRAALLKAPGWARGGLIDPSPRMRERAADELVGALVGDDIPDWRQMALPF